MSEESTKDTGMEEVMTKGKNTTTVSSRNVFWGHSKRVALFYAPANPTP